MNEKILGQALAEACEADLLCEEYVLPEGFEFSDEFERRMSGILGKTVKPNLHRRMKVVLIIAAIFASGFCLGMAKEPLWNFTVNRNSDGKNVSFDISSVDSPKKWIQEIYTISDLPEGFTFLNSWEGPGSYSVCWSRDRGDGSSDIITFGQYSPYAYYDAKFSDTAHYYIDDNGRQYYFDESTFTDGVVFAGVVWYQDGYVFLISGTISKEEAFRLCKTLKFLEKKE